MASALGAEIILVQIQVFGLPFGAKFPLCASRTVVMSHIRINYGRGSGYDI